MLSLQQSVKLHTVNRLTWILGNRPKVHDEIKKYFKNVNYFK